jgi:hypothetical protein
MALLVVVKALVPVKLMMLIGLGCTMLSGSFTKTYAVLLAVNTIDLYVAIVEVGSPPSTVFFVVTKVGEASAVASIVERNPNVGYEFTVVVPPLPSLTVVVVDVPALLLYGDTP